MDTPGTARSDEDLWVTLSREEIESVTYRRSVVAALPPEDQRLDDVLARLEYTIGQEHAEIRIAAARGPAGVLQPDLIGEPSYYDEEVGIHDRRAAVRDPILVRLPPAVAVGTDPCNGRLRGHVQELETHVAPGKGVVVGSRTTAGHSSIDGAQGSDLRTEDRIRQVLRVRLECPCRRVRIEADERRIVESVLEEVGEILHLILIET